MDARATLIHLIISDWVRWTWSSLVVFVNVHTIQENVLCDIMSDTNNIRQSTCYIFVYQGW